MKAAASRVYNLTANFRTVEGTRRCMELRRTRNRIPGIVYGGPSNKQKILVHADQFELQNLLQERGASFNSTLIDLTVEDEYDPNGKEKQKFHCVPRSISLHHSYDFPISCNWLIYDPAKGIKVDVPVVIEDRDKCPGLKRGAMVNRVHSTIPCLVKGPSLVDAIRVSIAGMNIGDRFKWSNINMNALPPGVTLECTHFRKDSWRREGIRDFTILSIDGGKNAKEEEEKAADESLEKF